jgi:tRNA dimethylallyltransferase
VTLPHALLVAGPTASGKSALALALAERLRGTIVNADSMQVYRELRVLTARPTPEEEARAPHELYGVRPAAEPGSVAWWRTRALAAMDTACRQGRLPILTGGTGLYFAALTQGLADIPAPAPQARAEARALLHEVGAPALHARLAAEDPVTAATLTPNDGQRIARAWHAQRATPAPWRVTAILLDPPRDTLRAAIAIRFAAMLEQGALDEVRALLAQRLDPALPAMRAHGVPELSACLRNEITLEQAGRRVEQVTGQYTKRQATWFRHHLLAARMHTIHARFADLEQFSERKIDEIIAFVQSPG